MGMLVLRYLLRTALFLALLILGLGLAVWSALILFRVEIPLERLRQPVEVIGLAALGRPVQIRGDLTLAHRFQPTV